MTLEQLLEIAVHRGDLLEVDSHFSQIGIVSSKGISHLKSALITLANITDFVPTVRGTYKEQPEPASILKKLEKNLEFSKYLRNKFVGHIDQGLIEKSVEWKPVLRDLPAKLEDSQCILLVNIWILETAINTYVDEDGKHKVFDSETDLMYPPDWQRFSMFLENTIKSSLMYLSALHSCWAPKITSEEQSAGDLSLAMKAGMTRFQYLQNKRNRISPSKG